ncbi:MAG: hypothetical protein HKN92_02595 [Chitinophagales bacterium]|nr:hypothetical protein [Chitinophagales bacterium]
MNIRVLNHIKFLSLILILGLSLPSCLDNEGYINSFSVGTIHETENLPEIQDADAIMMAIRKVAMVQQSGFDVVKTIGEANALFFDKNSLQTFTSVGDVAVNGNFLIVNPNNTYSFSVDLTNESGQIFDNEIFWNIEGDNGFSAMKKDMKVWPDVGPVNSPKVISSNSDYELSIEYLHDANATSFQISGLGALLKEYKNDHHLSHTFSQEDIQSLEQGPGIVQVNAYFIHDTIVNGKNVYFMNAEASFEVVEIK